MLAAAKFMATSRASATSSLANGFFASGCAHDASKSFSICADVWRKLSRLASWARARPGVWRRAFPVAPIRRAGAVAGLGRRLGSARELGLLRVAQRIVECLERMARQHHGIMQGPDLLAGELIGIVVWPKGKPKDIGIGIKPGGIPLRGCLRRRGKGAEFRLDSLDRPCCSHRMMGVAPQAPEIPQYFMQWVGHYVENTARRQGKLRLCRRRPECQ